MSLYNTKKVKELPQLEEIIEGNYLIVENETGTNIIDFADFVVGPNNVSFYNIIATLCSRSMSMSASVDAGFQSLSTNILSAVNVKVDALTANYPRLFEVYPNTITVNANAFYGKTDFNSEISSIVISDINVSPIDKGASLMNWALFLSSAVNPGSPNPYTYSIIISSTTSQSIAASFATKVTKYY